ncbi:MAG: hypothetical protein KDA78_11065 [Planctomycetaceae bacterium]|nr:hypothetical protein [Planctomycetaceae bacterium]
MKLPFRILTSLLVAIVAGLSGCGKSLQQGGTEQLLTSNAVDRVVSQIDFTPLSGQAVYLDDAYIKNIKGFGFVNSEYIISSLRQQIMAANCRLQETPQTADYIIEARVGALGTDMHEVSYGIPATNALSTASSLVPTAPPMPTIPEISLAKRAHHIGAAKIGVFAYHKESKEPVWQAGVKSGRSRSREAWFLGIGPLQTGTIYDGPMFAGARIKRPIRDILLGTYKTAPEPTPPVKYDAAHEFPLAKQLEQKREIKSLEPESDKLFYASHEEQVKLKELADQAANLEKATAPAEEPKQ